MTVLIAAVVVLGAGVAGDRTDTANSAPVTSEANVLPSVPGSRREEGSAGLTPAPIAVSMDVSRGAVAAYQRGDVAGSLEQFTAAAAADPQNADALNNLGQVLVRSGRAREAVPYFDRAIALAGGVWAYHFNRARAYGDAGEWARAIAGYQEAERLFPDDYATAYNLARALQENGDLTAAVSQFERAVALAPGEPDFHLAHAHALESAGRPQEAVAAYRRFLGLQASSPHAEKIAARIAALEAASPVP